MNISIKKLILLAFLPIVIIVACKKQDIGPKSDIRPAVPVTVQNAIDYRPDPTVGVSKSAVVSPGIVGPIQIILNIPAGIGRSITEITKVAAATSYTQIQSGGTTGFYNTAPIPGSGTSVTFNTTLTEYLAKAGGSIPAANNELAKRFYFLVTLDDGTQIVTDPVRVLVFN